MKPPESLNGTLFFFLPFLMEKKINKSLIELYRVYKTEREGENVKLTFTNRTMGVNDTRAWGQDPPPLRFIVTPDPPLRGKMRTFEDTQVMHCGLHIAGLQMLFHSCSDLL